MRKGLPIMLPVSADPGEEAGLRWQSFVRGQTDAASIDKANLPHGTLLANTTCPWIVEIEQFTRKRKVDYVLRCNGFGILDEHEHLRAGVHPMNGPALER